MSVLMWKDELVGVYTDFVAMLVAMATDAEKRGTAAGYSIEKIGL